MSEIFYKNEFIPSTLLSSDLNYIAETIINELSIIMETAAPSKVRQCQNS